jgi:DNA (cytosine-5)-methyltransferase 1
MAMRAIHLCCGGGGTTLGFEQASLETAFAFDVDPVAIETHKANFPSVPAKVCNIRGITARELPYSDVWTCGIPCEPFSNAGRRLGSADVRDISAEVARLIKEADRGKRPQFIFLENVPPYRGSTSAEVIRRALQDTGYIFNEAIFCHADYGVPQRRLRWHLIAKRHEWSIPWPEPTHCKGGPDLFGLRSWIHFGAIRDGTGVEPVSAKAIRFMLRHVARNAAKYGNAYMPAIIDDDSMLPTVMSGDWRGAGRAQVRLVYEAGVLRPLSFLEAKRGQGFPDSFVFMGNRKQQWQLVGQAVPPPFAAAVARAILEKGSSK